MVRFDIKRRHRKLIIIFVAYVVLHCLTGCATTSNSDILDPFESMNRTVYSFNNKLDQHILRPVAQTYDSSVPQTLKKCVSNVFANLNDVLTTVNQLFQGQPIDASSDVSRFILNSTFGFFGCFDPASELGLQKHDKNFGQTFAKWGVPEGPYIVLPLLGPNTLRDSIGLIPDYFVDPVNRIQPVTDSILANATRTVSTRASYLSISDLIESASLDPYLFSRDAFLSIKRRRADEASMSDHSQQFGK